MDAEIMKSIVRGCTVSTKVPDECEAIINDEEFPTIKPMVIDRLSKALTKLLSFKVSPEVYHRYSVRLNIIEVLRDWSQVKGDLGELTIFKDAERSYNFLIHILKKYLSEEILSQCEDVNNLVRLAEIIYNSLVLKRSLMKNYVRVIERIINLNQTEKSEKFLLEIIQKNDASNLDSCLIEKIYISQKAKLIEKPITDSFVDYCSDKNAKELSNSLDLLFERTVDSPAIFRSISVQLKEFFVVSKYDVIAREFIQKVLNKIEAYCDKSNKNILDLYPPNLHHCVILLRMKPNIHTSVSKSHTVQSLRDIFLKDYNDALILVSHFPEWLPEYLEFFNNSEPPSHDSDVQVITEIMNQV